MGHLAHPVWALAPLIAGLSGCWMRTEQQMMEREETMGGHLIALFDASEAVRAQDSKRFKAAMSQLEKGGDLPGIEGVAGLDALHATAAALRKVDERGAQARGVLQIAAQCSACHAQHQVQTPALFDPTTDMEDALGAIVWQDEDQWNQSWSALRPGAPSPQTWEARNAALAGVLGGI